MKMTLRERCARMLMVGFPGPTIDAELAGMIDEGVFGAVLFKKNITGPEQTVALNRELKERAGRPFLLAVDQEGGRVARLRDAPYTALPPMRALGQAGDAVQAERAGRLLAHELRAVGFDWDFAPVLDVDTNPRNPVIGDRSFHREAAEVARLGVALSRGLEAGGVASCGKHFPGHGDTLQDSHLTLPRLPHGLDRLRSVELPPFAAYARAGLASVMTAHVLFDAVDPGVPATLSEKVLKGLLREELGFQGVVVSDDLEMKAITEFCPIEEAVVRGARAGVDLFLICHTGSLQRRALEALVKAVGAGQLSHARVDEANARLDVLEKKFAHPVEDRFATLGTQEHELLARGFSAGSVGRDPTEPNA
jgi:beta-N-acetylhexosaminidase